jgi:hypothetical protein
LLQEEDEVVKSPGLPHCQQILARYHLKRKDLEKLKTLMDQNSFKVPNEQKQIDIENFSKDHNRHINLLNFARFVRENNIREPEMDEASKLLAQVVSTRDDIWKEDELISQNDSAVTPNSETISAIASTYPILEFHLACFSEFLVKQLIAMSNLFIELFPAQTATID